MKKIVSLIAIGFAFAAVLTFSSCKKDDDGDNCIDLLNKATTASENYVADQSTENCIAYKTAMTDYIGGCTTIDQTTKDQYLAAIEALNCDK